jgi:hypothetical protein
MRVLLETVASAGHLLSEEIPVPGAQTTEHRTLEVTQALGVRITNDESSAATQALGVRITNDESSAATQALGVRITDPAVTPALGVLLVAPLTTCDQTPTRAEGRDAAVVVATTVTAQMPTPPTMISRIIDVDRNHEFLRNNITEENQFDPRATTANSIL